MIDESYKKVIELRGIDEGHKILQVFTEPREIKICENREGGICGRHR
jgi:hypothetical protein